jgi:hypothetical protein
MSQAVPGSLDAALQLAVDKFTGVKDANDEPYILHLLRVMMAQTHPEARIVAVLHDLIEDTDVTSQDLASDGFAPQVIDAIQALTHRADESYCDYVVGLSKNPLAKSCKLADLTDNYSLHRVKYRLEVAEQDTQRLRKYILSYQFLSGKLDELAYRQAMTELESLAKQSS